MLTVSEKVEIVKKVGQGGNAAISRAAVEFSVPLSTVSDILKNRDATLRKWESGAGKTKASKRPKYEALDSALFQWFT